MGAFATPFYFLMSQHNQYVILIKKLFLQACKGGADYIFFCCHHLIRQTVVILDHTKYENVPESMMNYDLSL